MKANKKAWKSWVKAFAGALAFLIALITYASTRDYFIQNTNIYYVAFFEGACSMILIFLFAVKYGDSINEAYLGLRELGQRRLVQEEQKETQKHTQTENQG
jgi:hypothetical protein